MADEQTHPDEQDPLHGAQHPLPNEADAPAGDPNQAPTNRPADNARVAGPSEIEGFGWVPGDEATDFLGLNDPAEGAPAGDAFGAVDPYAMPGEGPVPDNSRTTWLLNEAGQPDGAPAAPQAADPSIGAESPSWLLEGQEPAPQPAPQRGELPLPESIQPTPQSPDPGTTDPNWLLSLDDQRANEGGIAPVVDGSQEVLPDGTQDPLEASFVDSEPTNSAVGRVVMRSLIAVGVIAGGAVLWQVLSHHGELDQPITEPIEMQRTALQNTPLEQPVDSTPGGDARNDPNMGAAGPERTAIQPGQPTDSPDSGRRWFSNLAPRATGAPSEPSELDGDSYPWAAPTEQEASEARSVLLAFDTLMADRPLADAGIEAGPEAGPAVEFDSLGVVIPDALPEVAGDRVSAGPPLVDPSAPAGQGWLALGQRLLRADQSVLDQYNAWRLDEDAPAMPGLTYVPRAGVFASVEPTFDIPWLVATLSLGGVSRESGPMPASDFEPIDQVPEPQMDPPGELVAVDLALDSLTSDGDTAETEDLDPRRIEQDPLFSLEARLPGKRDGRLTLDNHWAGANIPMHALDYPERILTPRVGAVRILHDNGEGFEGRLFAMGIGTVWLDTGIGRMALTGDAIRGIEKLDEGRLAALETDGTPTAGLPQIRVKAAGGVFVGFELERNGDKVTMLTDEGYKITLNSDDVEAASTRRATIGIKRRSQ